MGFPPETAAGAAAAAGPAGARRALAGIAGAIRFPCRTRLNPATIITRPITTRNIAALP